MSWIYNYQLFLFDFDGLLVNTEEIHFLAYKRMCAQRGVHFDWDFERYCRCAHYRAEALKEELYKHFPQLHAIEPSWDVLYAEKKQAVLDLVQEGAVSLMPGVEHFLDNLAQGEISRCVVTHSPQEFVNIIREQNPILNSIPTWFTRKHYNNPKPDPECYLKAIEKLASTHDRVIGFEDTPRGINALLGTRAKPVLVCQASYPEIPQFIQKGVEHFSNLEEVLSKGIR